MASLDTINEEFILHNDAGDEVRFTGRLFSESSYYDEDQGALTRLKLFVTDDGRQIYSVVSNAGATKWRRVYTMRVDGDLCRISNGIQEMTLEIDMLLTVVSGLCGIDAVQGADVRAFLEVAPKNAYA